MNKPLLVIFLLCLGLNGSLSGQDVRDTTIKIMSIDFSGGYHAPMGDMTDRFGGNGHIGLTWKLKTRNNLMFSIDGSFLFGSDVKEEVAINVRTADGFVIDRNGNFANVLILQRGMAITANTGKIFPIVGPNPNSGLCVQLGVGLLQHNIRLESRNNEVPAIEGENRKGYDRLSNGLSLHQAIGYQYYGNRRFVNFYVGIEAYQAFTQSRREYNFDLMMKDETERFDGLIGLKLMWSLPIKRTSYQSYRFN